MPHASRADLSRAFSSYCGYPPMGHRHAQVALSIQEPARLDAPLEEFLVCNDGGHDSGA